MLSIDVIIPSYRLQSEYLLAMIQMDIPPETVARYIIVADNPALGTPKELLPVIDNKKVVLLRNPENYGVCKTRNIGIDNATADWVLFLDDDVRPSKNLLLTYVQAIKSRPDEIGFFGEVIFPKATTSFQQGMIASDILTFFSLVGKMDHVKWTPTANVIIKRSAIGNVRFNEKFPKNGAGEEVEFFLNIYKSTHQELQCIPNAQVFHNWWYDGKRVYTRFLRWNYGMVLLHESFPEYTYYNFPNVVETILIALLPVVMYCFYMHSVLPLMCLIVGCFLGEFAGEFLRLFRSRGIAKSIYAIETTLIKLVNDIGRLGMVLQKGKIPAGLCLRFEVFCDGKHIKPQRLWGGIKFIGYVVFSAILYCFLKSFIK